MSTPKRTYVLDTNVLMHDPSALFRFAEHDLYLPMTVLEELDAAKKGSSEVARNARQASRFLNELVAQANGVDIADGLPIDHPLGVKLGSAETRGRLWFQTTPASPAAFGGAVADNAILAATIDLTQRQGERRIVLVTKDINLRIKAAIARVKAEDYHNDQALDDLSLLYAGFEELPEDFWDRHPEVTSRSERGLTIYEIKPLPDERFYPNQGVFMPEENGFEALVREVHAERVVLEVADDYRPQFRSVWGITARNREQNFALNLLMDPDVDFVSLMGTAGTGKTLLSLAAGLAQTLDQQRYREIIVTRATIPVGEDIGFLPGTEEEKMTPWMGALSDNLEVLAQPHEGGGWGRAATQDLLSSRIKIRSLNFMRGRTFFNRFLIVDEAQNLTSKQMKTLVTRAGPGTKVICLGNVEQIDTPYLTETTSGLTYVVDRFKSWAHSGHITLKRGERSRLADFASEAL